MDDREERRAAGVRAGGLNAARSALAAGDPDRVGELWAEVDPGGLGETARLEWALLLAEAGDLGAAAEAARPLAGTALAEVAARALGPDEEPAGSAPAGEPTEPEDPFAVDVGTLRGAAPSSDEAVVDLFLRRFGGRGDVYAQQWHDERRRRSGYRLVEEPLTAAVARAHLGGSRTVGQYLIYPDGTCAYGVIDLDLSGSALAELRATAGEAVPPTASGPLRTYALRLLETGRKLGLPLFPEDSGSRGLHLWLFFEPRRPARAVRALLGQVVAAAGGQPPDVGVEVFPKGDRTGPRGLSSLVKLPLGLHQATLRRCPLLDERLEPIGDPLAALERLAAAPPDLVDSVLGRRVLVLPEVVEAGPPLPALPAVATGRSLAEALRAVEPGKPERAACEAMLEGCAVLRRIARRAYDERRLEPAHARAFLYTIGLVGPACELADDVFAAAGISRKELDRARAGLPSPAGCAKLRKLGLASPPDCPCPVADRAQPYATPALLAVGGHPAATPARAPFAEWLEGDPGLAADPLGEVAARLASIDDRLGRLERRAGEEAPGASQAAAGPDQGGACPRPHTEEGAPADGGTARDLEQGGACPRPRPVEGAVPDGDTEPGRAEPPAEPCGPAAEKAASRGETGPGEEV